MLPETIDLQLLCTVEGWPRVTRPGEEPEPDHRGGRYSAKSKPGLCGGDERVVGNCPSCPSAQHLPSFPGFRLVTPPRAWRPCHSRQVGAASPCPPCRQRVLVAAANLDPHFHSPLQQTGSGAIHSFNLTAARPLSPPKTLHFSPSFSLATTGRRCTYKSASESTGGFSSLHPIANSADSAARLPHPILPSIFPRPASPQLCCTGTFCGHHDQKLRGYVREPRFLTGDDISGLTHCKCLVFLFLCSLHHRALGRLCFSPHLVHLSEVACRNRWWLSDNTTPRNS